MNFAWLYNRKNFEGSRGYTESFLFGIVHIHWRMNPDISTMFIKLPLFFQYLVLGGWAGNGFSAIHIQWHKQRLLTIDIRTGCRGIWRKQNWRTPYETNIIVRLGQMVYKKWPSKEQYPAWSIEIDSQHFCLIAQRIAKWFPLLASYNEHDEHETGHYFASARILWFKQDRMF